jgi:hypothetical protein
LINPIFLLPKLFPLFPYYYLAIFGCLIEEIPSLGAFLSFNKPVTLLVPTFYYFE